jgi:hypothetical protein
MCAAEFGPSLYENLDLMIGTAFHSVAFAIQAAVPVIAIAYAPKVRRLMAEVGLGEYVLEPDEWYKLAERVDRVLGVRRQIVGHLHETTAALNESVQQTMAAVRRDVELANARVIPAPKVSIVVVGSAVDAHNRATVESCLEQTCSDVEVLFVADRGDTPAVSALQTVSVDANLGLGERLNRAFSQARGEYLTWIVSGDVYARDAIRVMAHHLWQDPACDMVFADYYGVTDGERLAYARSVRPAQKLYRQNGVGPCFLYRRRLSEQVGPFRADVPLVAYDYWLRAHEVCELRPLHVRLFYARTWDEVVARHAERQTRRLWRSSKGWPTRIFWRFVDAEWVDRYVVRPAMAILNGVRSLLLQRAAG